MEFSGLIKQVTKETGQPTYKVEAVIRSTFRQIEAALKSAGEAEVDGFGRFTVQTLADRTNARNFHTGEIMTAKGRNRIWFKPTKRLSRAMRFFGRNHIRSS